MVTTFLQSDTWYITREFTGTTYFKFYLATVYNDEIDVLAVNGETKERFKNRLLVRNIEELDFRSIEELPEDQQEIMDLLYES